MNYLLDKIKNKKSKVLIIGLGYVGWPLYCTIKKKGFDVILAFIIQREDCQKFKIADDIDPEYKKLLTFALKNSLKIICYDCKFLAKGIKINKKIKFIN